MAIVYILHSKTADKFYTGSCLNLEERLLQHKNKFYSKSFTSKYDDWELFISIDNLQYQQARKIENHIKRMKSKTYIQNLSLYPNIIEKLKSKYQWAGGPDSSRPDSYRDDPGLGYLTSSINEGVFLYFYTSYLEQMKQKKYDNAYLKMAKEWAKLSHCQRKQVGALIVKDKMIISDGYNGCPSGFENNCEDENGDTKWYVLHAEANAIMKVARSTNDCKNATLYLTLSPCKECSKLIHQAGIKRLVYLNEYKDTTGLDFLRKANIDILHYTDAE